MAADNPRDGAPARDPDGVLDPPIHQWKDKSAKLVYGDKQIVAEFLAKHVFGKIVPADVAARIDLDGLQPGPTEHTDSKLRASRFADLVWQAPFRDSWLHIVLLLEFQSTSDWRMPVRILLETALIYDYLSKKDDASAARELPPVLPIVVHMGTRPWTAATRLEDLLGDEAKAFLPFALGHQSVLVSEAEEARELQRVMTAHEAGLKLRYATDGAEFTEAASALRALLPRDSTARDGLIAWVRNSMIEAGAKEEDVAQLEKLGDLEGPVVETWWVRERKEMLRKGRAEGREEGRAEMAEAREEGRREGREEGRAEGREEGRAEALVERRATLVHMARRKFDAGTASELGALLEEVSGSGRLTEITDLIFDCATGQELLTKAATAS